MRHRLIRLFLLLALASSAVPARDPVALRHALAALAERGVVGEPEAWAERLLAQPVCDGEQAAELLLKAAGLFAPVGDVRAALELLERRGLTGSAEYWVKATAAGRSCDSANLAVLLGRIAARLPWPPARPLAAAPLEAAAPDALKERYDVVIAGAGTGGCGAAIQAARMGCSVLLLEETDWIGGQMNAAAVTSMDEGGTLVRERGLYRELCDQIAAHYQPLGLNFETAYWMRHVCVEPRVGRRILHVMLADARGQGTLDLVLRARVTRVLRDGDTVVGAAFTCVTPEGPVTRTVASRVLIDATESGDVIPLTGARYRTGNCLSDAVNPASRVQENTWCAVVKHYPGGVPPALLVTNAPPGYTEAVHRHFLRTLIPGDTVTSSTNRPWNVATFIGYRGMPDSSRPGDAPPITRTHLNYNNDYPNTVADLEDESRRRQTLRAMRLKTLHLLHYIQHTLGKADWSVAADEGYDTPYNRAQIDAWLAEQPELAPYRPILYHFPVMAYTRESRRIVGVHTLTAREIERHPGPPTRFASCVALGDYGVDLHGARRPQDLEPDLDRPEDIPDEGLGVRGVGPFTIPFECLIPERLDGFLAAEKNFSQSRLANGATRLQPHTLLIGQAAGAAAALAVRHGVPPRRLDPVLVQRVLLDARATLFIKPLPDVRQSHPDWKAVQLVLTHGLLRETEKGFEPDAPLGEAERAAALERLAGGPLPPPALALPLTRLEAARALAAFLERRAESKTAR